MARDQVTTPEAASDLRTALRRVRAPSPSEAREGGLIVQAPRITEHELDAVRTALLHPREKADVTAFAVSLASSLALIGKTIADAARAGKPSWWDMIVFAAAAVLVFATTSRFATQRRKKQPFHDKALAYVEALIVEKAADAAKPPALPEQAVHPPGA